MKKAMITWRENSAAHYVNENDIPICGAFLLYSEVWETPADVTCQKCKRIFKNKRKMKVIKEVLK